MRLKRFMTILLTLSLIFTSGCWDMVEIERRAIVGVAAIDLVDKNEENQEGKETTPYSEDKPMRIRVTFGINNPSKVMEGGEGAAVPITVDAVNLPDAMEKLGGKISRIPFYGHTRLLIFSDKLLKDREVFMELVDEFERKAVINEQMRIVAFKGDPKDIEKVDIKLENLYSTYIYGIMENSRVLSNTVSMTLHQLLTELRNSDGNTSIPLLEIEKGKQNVFTIDKLALVNNYKLLTILDSKYVKTYKLVNGVFESGRKVINYNGTEVPFFIYNADRKIWLMDNKEKLSFKVKLMLEGDIEQFELEKMLFDPKVLADVEKTIEKNTKEELDATTKYFQSDIAYDYLGFREYMNKYHYKEFKKYEDNWEEAFKNARIEYEVDAYIRRIGTSKK